MKKCSKFVISRFATTSYIKLFNMEELICRLMSFRLIGFKCGNLWPVTMVLVGKTQVKPVLTDKENYEVCTYVPT